jgi:hypothetical protein
VSAEDGSADLTIPSGALSTQVAITVTPDTALSQASATIGAAYRFEPEDTEFAQPADVRLTFGEGAFRRGTDLTLLRLARRIDDVWTPLSQPTVVTPADREVRGEVHTLGTLGLWADPCLARLLDPAGDTWSEQLTADDCPQSVAGVDGPSQFFQFSIPETTALDFDWSSSFAFATGLKVATNDPWSGTVLGSARPAPTGTSGPDAFTAALTAILPPGDYQLHVAADGPNTLGSYDLNLGPTSLAAATSGQPCDGSVLIVPGATVIEASLDASTQDCQSTTADSPFPGWAGQSALLDTYEVRLQPGRSYVVQVTSSSEPAPSLLVRSRGELRRQQTRPESSERFIELTPAEAASFEVQVMATAPAGATPEALPYELSVREGMASSDPNLVPAHDVTDPRDDGTGAFRTHCLETHQLFDDPLVAPRQPGAAHHHVFIGNPTADAYSTIESLQHATSTACDGGTLNRSAYWVPALFDARGERIEYVDPLIYYKTGYHLPIESIVAPPAGLRMIAGNARAAAPQSVDIVKFRCESWTTDEPQFEPGDPHDHVPYLPDCALDDIVEMRLVFPQCWDGVHLSAPDNQSHMAYPRQAIAPITGTGSCPPSHPIAIPEISYNFHVYVTEETGPPSSWRFSSSMNPAAPGGTSFHGDWMNGWDEATMQTIVENCLHGALECGVGLLGNGLRLRPVVED